MRVKIKNLPEPGFGVSVDAHEYTLVRYEPHTRGDGEETRLGVWSGTCSTCGEPFDQRAPLHVIPETRRCDRHRKPGRKAA